MQERANEDTIVAIATPSGVGAISVIRVSGPASLEAVEKIFVSKEKLSKANTHTIHYGRIEDLYGNQVDDVLVSVFRAPNSYTGEDSVEISTHGNPLIGKKIIESLVKNGVRIAEAGEFTKRAYLNNKIDLAQAEAVLDIINSRTEASLLGARNQLDGLLSGKVNELRQMLVDTASFIELELDFAEEDIELIDNSELKDRICGIIEEISKLLKTYSFGKVLKEGVNVALVGKPNVGKSSLLNYILKESRAIVSPIPGTTRDVIREDVSIDGILFRLYDTAGIRLSEDEIEKEGVLRSQNVVKNADIVLFMEDVLTNGTNEILGEIKNITKPRRILNIVNKIDLDKNYTKRADIYISALTGEGIETLFDKMKELALGSSVYTEKSAIVSSLRHYDCLKKAIENLENALISIEKKLSGEFISVDIRNAAMSLGEVIGEVTSEDILNNIFSRFCIGK